MKHKDPTVLKFYLQKGISNSTQTVQMVTIAKARKELQKKIPGVFEIENLKTHYRLSIDAVKMGIWNTDATTEDNVTIPEKPFFERHPNLRLIAIILGLSVGVIATQILLGF